MTDIQRMELALRRRALALGLEASALSFPDSIFIDNSSQQLRKLADTIQITARPLFDDTDWLLELEQLRKVQQP